MPATPLATPYASVEALKLRQGANASKFDGEYGDRLLAASQYITDETGRRFSLADHGGNDARIFRPRPGGRYCLIDDLSASSVDAGFTVETSTNGQSGPWTTYTGAVPNNVQGHGVADRLEADGPLGNFPYGARCWVRVTPDDAGDGWGWDEIPHPIVEATLIEATRLLKRKGTPEGVIAFADTGVRNVTPMDPDVKKLIRPYCRVTKWAP